MIETFQIQKIAEKLNSIEKKILIKILSSIPNEKLSNIIEKLGVVESYNKKLTSVGNDFHGEITDEEINTISSDYDLIRMDVKYGFWIQKSLVDSTFSIEKNISDIVQNMDNIV